MDVTVKCSLNTVNTVQLYYTDQKSSQRRLKNVFIQDYSNLHVYPSSCFSHTEHWANGNGGISEWKTVGCEEWEKVKEQEVKNKKLPGCKYVIPPLLLWERKCERLSGPSSANTWKNRSPANGWQVIPITASALCCWHRLCTLISLSLTHLLCVCVCVRGGTPVCYRVSTLKPLSNCISLWLSVCHRGHALDIFTSSA